MGGTVKLIVLDRDGSLGQIPEDFVRSPDDWVPQPGALEAVARLNQAGWRVVVASNQSGLGRGLFDMATLNAVHARMHKLLAAAGARVDAVFVCPHAPEEGCACRKPEPGLLQQIGQRYGVALSEIRAVGDSLNDVRAAVAAGCQPHLLLCGLLQAHGGPGGLPLPAVPEGCQVHKDLAAFADSILARDANSEKN